MTKNGESAVASPTAASRKRPDIASFEFDEQSVCAVASCLWDPAISSFERRLDFVDNFEQNGVRLKLIAKIESTKPNTMTC